MQVWRITKAKHATTAFSGEGARRFGGRWNGKGTAMVYCASTLSLAALETFVHLEVQDAGNLLVAIPVELDASIQVEWLAVADLPANWRGYPAPAALSRLGDEWVAANRSAALIAPSVVIPSENNVLLNPNHPQFAQMQIGEPQPFGFDPRMWK